MIAVLGQCIEDIVTETDGLVEVRLGGPPFFSAVALARERLAAVIATRGGSEELRTPLSRLGFDVVIGPEGRTFVSEMQLAPNGERFEAIRTLGEGFSVEDAESWLAPAIEGVGTVVCGAVWRDDFPPGLLRRFASQGRRVFLDGQGWARPARIGRLILDGPLDPAAVSGVSVLKLSEDEARIMIGGIDATAPERVGVPVIVVTRGERGAVLLAGGRAHAVGVEPVYGLADTIGAGDAFLAVMAAAMDAGADALQATETACTSVSRLLRDRLYVSSLHG